MAFSSKTTRKLITSLHMVRHFAKRANPGLSHQINAIEDAADVIQSDPEGFGGLESDLFNAHKSHKQHELEEIRQREKIKQYLIKGKYFRKDLNPNMLTYAEKQQIRYLHSVDPEEWTVDKLADSFPTSAEIISKILKSGWTALSAKRIHAHDASVVKNWERFKKGEFKSIMSEELEQHLNNFANRNFDKKTFENLANTFPKRQWQKPTSNEFSSLISTLSKKTVEDERKGQEVGNICLNSETYQQKKMIRKKPINIHEWKNKLVTFKSNEKLALSNETNACGQLSARKDENIDEAEKVDNSNNLPSSDGGNDFYKKFSSNEVNITEVDRKVYEISQMKHRIYIPKKLWQKGKTYRANDCFYDDDGEFLYKVPGMCSP